ncbi:HEAT repeat domain-containing protein [Streptomyces violaceusniger]|uniref:HEAT repeat domain-containing protein n=1 Tax=Streptomyces violaceusniger TaxID=68280 RepID=UPI00381939B7
MTLPSALAAGALLLSLTGRGGNAEAGGKTVTVTIGYQSKTINTVTAGTLLRSLGSFERELRALGRRDGHTYKVKWEDYATGAPITAQMIAGKVDIGSMGDFPLLINSGRGTQLNAPTRLVSVTGYNLRDGLNTVLTAPGSKLRALSGLRGKNVSTSVGSAADGTLVRALQQAGIDPEDGIHKLNQQPAVGASALEAGSADALSQFVAWPGLLAFQGKAKALYDGARLNLPSSGAGHPAEARASRAAARTRVSEAVAALGDSAWQVRKGAATALSAAASELGVPALARALSDAHADVRKAAVLALLPLAERGVGAAREALSSVRSDPDADVRAYAAKATA